MHEQRIIIVSASVAGMFSFDARTHGDSSHKILLASPHYRCVVRGGSRFAFTRLAASLDGTTAGGLHSDSEQFGRKPW